MDLRAAIDDAVAVDDCVGGNVRQIFKPAVKRRKIGFRGLMQQFLETVDDEIALLIVVNLIAGAHDALQIISVPAAFTKPTGEAHWEVLLRARAIETGAFVIAPAQGGVHEDGRTTYGHSMIVNPWGEVIAQLDHDEPGMIVADLDLDEVAAARAKIPAWQGPREFAAPKVLAQS